MIIMYFSIILVIFFCIFLGKSEHVRLYIFKYYIFITNIQNFSIMFTLCIIERISSKSKIYLLNKI